MKLLVASLVLAAATVLHGQQSPLDQPQPLQMSALVPLERAETFLLASRIAFAIRMPLGFESAEMLPAGNSRRQQQPLAGISVREAFNQIVALDPRYEWREVDGVAVFRPKAAWTDSANVLNRHVENFNFENVTLAKAADVLLGLLFKESSPVPSVQYPGATLSVHVASGTVLDVLDASIKPSGTVWTVGPVQAGHRLVSLATSEGGGTIRSWPVE